MQRVAECAPQVVNVVEQGSGVEDHVFGHCFARVDEGVQVEQHAVNLVHREEQLVSPADALFVYRDDVSHLLSVLEFEEVAADVHVCFVLNKVGTFNKAAREVDESFWRLDAHG